MPLFVVLIRITRRLLVPPARPALSRTGRELSGNWKQQPGGTRDVISNCELYDVRTMKMFAVAVHRRTSLFMKQQLPARPSFRDNTELARQRSWWGRYGRRDLLKWPRAATAVNYRRKCTSFSFSFSFFFHFSAQLLRHDLSLRQRRGVPEEGFMKLQFSLWCRGS